MSAKTWKLKRVVQCAKCPWKKKTNPHEIPNGYSKEKHCALEGTIAEPGDILGILTRDPLRVMACHEEHSAHCVGWLKNQIGPGNNIGLRLRMMTCENAGELQTVGAQHQTFEETLPA